MSDTVEKEYLATMTSAALGLAHCLLGIGVLMILFMILVTMRQCLQRKSEKPVPLPTPPIYRRKPSSHTVYPPTPPISRQQMSIYSICRPTPPESPLASIASGKRQASPFGPSPSKPFCYLQEPRRCSLQFAPPVQPHRNSIHSAAFLPADRSYHQALRSTWSLPGSSYRLLES